MRAVLLSLLLAGCTVAQTEPSCTVSLAAAATHTGYESWTSLTLDIVCDGEWNLNYGFYAGASGVGTGRRMCAGR